MDYVLKILQNERALLLDGIEKGQQESIAKKMEIEMAIAWLDKIKGLGLGRVSEYNFVKLPDMNTGYSEYHIMNDCESGNINDWIELKSDKNYPITLNFDDVLISSRPK